MKKRNVFFVVVIVLFNLAVLLVYGIGSITGGAITGESVTGGATQQSTNISITVVAAAPTLHDIDDEIFVCENTALSHFVNGTDQTGDDLTFNIVPSNPFYVSSAVRYNTTVMTAELFSGIINKDDSGRAGSTVYVENVSVTDGTYVDSESINITVIEINNAPSISNIGVHTVWAQGANATFSKQVSVTDTEDGNQFGGNLSLNSTFLNGAQFFSINQTGYIGFTANDSIIGNYDISVCATDHNLTNPHQNISLCGQDGSNQTTCQNFSLTVTDSNRAPEITFYYPANLNFSASGTDSLYFNISENDDDGTVPDAYWYADGVRKEYDAGSSVDDFTYSFGCGVSGEHTVKAEITDGLLNDSVQWNVTVSLVSCAAAGGAAAGGGGGGGGSCLGKWACHDWFVCQNLNHPSGIAVLAEEQVEMIRQSCLENGWSEEFCGFQMRDCFDVNTCGTVLNRPEMMQACYFTSHPTCDDGVKNCHDGSCEFLIDCGGPCVACPSCGDGIKNQGEEEVDCGGPCPECQILISPKPVEGVNMSIYLTAIFAVLLIILAIVVFRVLRMRQRVKQSYEQPESFSMIQD